MIKVSAPGKIHLLGEHAVVYGKPAILAAIDLRVTVHLRGEKMRLHLGGGANLAKTIEPIVKKHLHIKTIPPYQLTISSQLPIGSGLGSSAAISAAYIATLLSYLSYKWDLNLVNELTFEAEKVFHGNPSGADNTTIVYGGLIYYIKGKPSRSLPFSIPPKLAKNFMLINTGTPKESTRQLVESVKNLSERKPAIINKFLEDQESLVRQLLSAIKTGDAALMIHIIRAGEKNLESIGVTSPFARSIIRKIEKAGGAAKICGAGGITGPTGILLCYHPNPTVIKNIAKSYQLDYIKTTLGVEGLRQEFT